MKILLVEDDDLLRNSLKNILSLISELEVFEACDGKEALKQLQLQQFDILFTDFRMPELTGLELLSVLRSQGSQILVIACSAFADRDDFKSAISLNVFEFVEKPYRSEELLEKVKKAMESIKKKRLYTVGQLPLKPQQIKILNLILENLSNAEIATKMGLAEQSIKYHVGQLLEHFELKSRAQLKQKISELLDKES